MAEKNDLKRKEKENKKAEKQMKNKGKKKLEPTKIFSAVIAGILCLMMVLSVCGTLIMYLTRG